KCAAKSRFQSEGAIGVRSFCHAAGPVAWARAKAEKRAIAAAIPEGRSIGRSFNLIKEDVPTNGGSVPPGGCAGFLLRRVRDRFMIISGRGCGASPSHGLDQRLFRGLIRTAIVTNRVTILMMRIIGSSFLL